MPIDKSSLKATLLSLEQQDIANAEAAYQAFIAGARYDAEQTVEDDDIAQAIVQRNLAEEAEIRVHEHEAHAEQIEAIAFAPTTTVEPGAIVKLAGADRRLVVAIATAEFRCDDIDYIGISTAAPLYEAMEGLSAGDSFDFRGRAHQIESVS